MTNYRAIALVDLDDTLFQTRRKCPAELPFEVLTPMAFGADGQPISYATPRQMTLIRWLEETALVVPVTARSTAALLRTRLRFEHAVSAHGAVILNGFPERADDIHNVRCSRWHAQMDAALAPFQPALITMETAILSHASAQGLRVRARIVSEDGLPLYLVIKHQEADGNDAELQAATGPARQSLPAGWTCHLNGNNVAFLPPGLGKAHAVAVVLEALRADHPDLPVIGMGDSHTDAGFMALCDFAMTPTGSQLAGRLLARA
ncbi:hypothetical protein [Sandarakinorhabdus sp.]|uniref:hypothetical protein n=1 Tax=Sandarakinorhabdus sp. TaxID=1916663 RepID=UPI003F708105